MRKYAALDLWRFVFALLIMACHCNKIGADASRLFRQSWVYVEFYFMVTGFLTAKHMLAKQVDSEGTAIYQYTLKKYFKLLPYLFVAITTAYLLVLPQVTGKTDLLKYVQNYVGEMLLLTASELTSKLIGPLWYLSAMLLMLPLYCFALTNKKIQSLFFNYFCWLYPLLYYGKTGFSGTQAWPHDFLRAFAGLSLGCFVYRAVLLLKNCKFLKKPFVIYLLTFLEWGCLGGTVILNCFNVPVRPLILFMMIGGLILLLSENTLSQQIKGGLFSFLGRISLPIYLWHIPVYMAVNKFFGTASLTVKLIFSYALVLIISILTELLVSNLHKRRRVKVELSTELKDNI